MLYPIRVHHSRWSGQLMGWLASHTLQNEGRQDLSLPRVVCKYKDVFPNELPRLPSHRDVDFIIELHKDLSLPRVIYKYKDVFPDELPRLPSHRDVDFIIELHLGT